MTQIDKDIDRIIDEASEWFVTIEAGDATDTDKACFAEWLNASPIHAREYAEAASLWDETRIYGEQLDPESPVIQLYPKTPATKPDEMPHSSVWKEWRNIAAAVIVGILATGILAYTSLKSPSGVTVANLQRYTTEKGESRRVRLNDGSFVQLNTDSSLEVAFTDGFRELTLLQGEAYFEVSKDPRRPFIVGVNTTRVQAVGTQFNINKRREKIEVTVLEGKVRVSEEATSRSSKWITDLVQGEQVITRSLSQESPPKSDPVFQKKDQLNLRTVLSWRDNKLIFDHRNLNDVVEDFNRYNDLTIILASPGLDQIKVSGTFNPNDPESFAQSITSIANIRTETTKDGRIIFYKIP